MMETNPRRRNRGQVPSDAVAEALQYQQAYVHRELAFNTGAISDCSESLEQMRTDKREARESRDMMWEDHYATLINTELARAMAAKKKKLAQETATLSQLASDRDKWNMAIELHMLEYLSASLSTVDLERRKEYFSSYQKSGQTPLHRACKANDAELVQLLVSLGAELVATDEAGKVGIARDKVDIGLPNLLSDACNRVERPEHLPCYGREPFGGAVPHDHRAVDSRLAIHPSPSGHHRQLGPARCGVEWQ